MNTVDVTIYLQTVKETLSEEEFRSMVYDEYGIEDFESFIESLEYEIHSESLSSYNETGNPKISDVQFMDCLMKAVAQYHIDALKQEGLLQSIIDDGEIKYQLTDKGKQEAIRSCN